MVYNAKNIFWIALSKIGRKITFDYKTLLKGPEELFWYLVKLVFLQYSLGLTSIFIIKVDFPSNIDVLSYGKDI
jgi:hypothetical protein